MSYGDDQLQILRQLLDSQLLAVLATTAGPAPYASLVAVALSDDLRRLYFATPRATRKAANLAANPRVALLIDNRGNREEDFSRAAAATLLGTAHEPDGAGREAGVALFVARHPHLAGFVAAPGCAFFEVRLTSIYLVTRFQEVIEFHFPP